MGRGTDATGGEAGGTSEADSDVGSDNSADESEVGTSGVAESQSDAQAAENEAQAGTSTETGNEDAETQNIDPNVAAAEQSVAQAAENDEVGHPESGAEFGIIDKISIRLDTYAVSPQTLADDILGIGFDILGVVAGKAFGQAASQIGFGIASALGLNPVGAAVLGVAAGITTAVAVEDFISNLPNNPSAPSSQSVPGADDISVDENGVLRIKGWSPSQLNQLMSDAVADGRLNMGMLGNTAIIAASKQRRRRNIIGSAHIQQLRKGII